MLLEKPLGNWLLTSGNRVDAALSTDGAPEVRISCLWDRPPSRDDLDEFDAELLPTIIEAVHHAVKVAGINLDIRELAAQGRIWRIGVCDGQWWWAAVEGQETLH